MDETLQPPNSRLSSEFKLSESRKLATEKTPKESSSSTSRTFKRPWAYRYGASNVLGNDLPSEEFISLQKATGLSSIALHIAWQRGLKTADSIQNFLSPRLENLADPFILDDLEKGVNRVCLAVHDNHKVRVFGDYDVDGTTGAALLSWVFRYLKMDFDATQPDRFRDGYGLNVPAVEKAATEGVRLLITVDCGITSFSAIERASELGIDVIVLDHHQIDNDKGLPTAFAIVNPQRGEFLRELCGCGVAFYFVRALRQRLREQGFFSTQYPPYNLRQHLDLVVLATAADMVPLTGENHILVRHGMEVLKTSAKPGIRHLLQVSGIETKSVGQGRTLSPSHLGFTLGPRINASGRMQNAQIALRLLTTQDETEAADLAIQIENLNTERMQVQNEIWDEVQKRIQEGLAAGKFEHSIVVADEKFHEGVVGIVASRIVERYHLPAAVIAIHNGIGKGSVRSFAHKDVLQALRQSSSYLIGFGGHMHAAGFSLNSAEIVNFSKAFDFAIAHLPEAEDQRPLYFDLELAPTDSSLSQTQLLKVAREIELLGPFGNGNPEPLFLSRAKVRSKRVLKERHLKFDFSWGQFGESSVEGIWFYSVEQFAELPEMIEGIEFAYALEVNRFRGVEKPSFRIKDARI